MRYLFDITLISFITMPNLTLRDVPVGLHAWLRQQATTHHRSLNKEIVDLLEKARGNAGSGAECATAEEILEIGRRAAALPVQDRRSEDEILGYNGDGLPD